MKGIALCCVAICGIFAYLILFVGILAAIGAVLSLIYTYSVLAIWPTLPAILWWQFSLMAFGLNLIRNLVCGAKT
jgi:hypothetical protein